VNIGTFFGNGVLSVFRGLPLDSNTRVAYICQGSDSNNNFTTDWFVEHLGHPSRTHCALLGNAQVYTWQAIASKIHSYRQRINVNMPIRVTQPAQGEIPPWIPRPPPGEYNAPVVGREIFMILDTRYSETENPATPGFSGMLPLDEFDLVSRQSICYQNRHSQETALAGFSRTYVFLDRSNRALPMSMPPIPFQRLNTNGVLIEPDIRDNPYQSNFICVDPRAYFPRYKPNIIKADA